MKQIFFNLRRLTYLMVALLGFTPIFQVVAGANLTPAEISGIIGTSGAKSQENFAQLFDTANLSNVSGLSIAASQALVNDLVGKAQSGHASVDISKPGSEALTAANLQTFMNAYTSAATAAQSAVKAMSANAQAQAQAALEAAATLLGVSSYALANDRSLVLQQAFGGIKFKDPVSGISLTGQTSAGLPYNQYLIDQFEAIFSSLEKLYEQSEFANLTPDQKKLVDQMNAAITQIGTDATEFGTLANTINSDTRAGSGSIAAAVDQTAAQAALVAALNQLNQDLNDPTNGYSALMTQITNLQADVASQVTIVNNNLATLGSALDAAQISVFNSELSTAQQTFNTALKAVQANFPTGMPTPFALADPVPAAYSSFSSSLPVQAVTTLHNALQTYVVPTKSVTAALSQIVTDTATLNIFVAGLNNAITAIQNTGVQNISSASGLVPATAAYELALGDINTALNDPNAGYLALYTKINQLQTDVNNQVAIAGSQAAANQAAFNSAVTAATAANSFPSGMIAQGQQFDLINTPLASNYANSVPGVAVAALGAALAKVKTSSGGGGLSKGATAGIIIGILAAIATGIAIWKWKPGSDPDPNHTTDDTTQGIEMTATKTLEDQGMTPADAAAAVADPASQGMIQAVQNGDVALNDAQAVAATSTPTGSSTDIANALIGTAATPRSAQVIVKGLIDVVAEVAGPGFAGGVGLGLSAENQASFANYVEEAWVAVPKGSYSTFVMNTARQIQADAASFGIAPDQLMTWVNDPNNFTGTDIAEGTDDAYQSIINALNVAKAAAAQSGSQFEPITLEASDFQAAAEALVSSGKAGGASEGVEPTTGTGTGGLAWLSQYSALAGVTDPGSAYTQILAELQKGLITMDQFQKQLSDFSTDADEYSEAQEEQAEQIFDAGVEAGREVFGDDWTPPVWG